MDRRHTTEERRRRHAAGQRRITRRCTCGRLLTGNAAWWSHTRRRDGAEREGHHYAGTR